jgi:tRNA A37 threonylcarbamoyladenosine synthetase subunit TsaC/SUA5/YrdC
LFIVDGGARRGSEVSTVVEFSKGRATLRRRGAVSAESIAFVVPLAEEPHG